MATLSPFEEIPTNKKIPSSAKILELLGTSDLVKERYTTSQEPYSGQGAGIGSGLNSRITFKIFNNSDYADLSTAYITFNAQFTNTNAGALVHLNAEDNVLSWFNLVRVSVNDQILEEINNFNIWTNLITYASMGKSYYETAGSFQGCYRHSTYLTGGPRGLIIMSGTNSVTAGITTLDFGTQVNGAQNWEQLAQGAPSWVTSATTGVAPTAGSGGNDTWASRALQSGTGYNYSAPLAGYLGLFSLQKYFPLRSVASVTLELNMSTNIASVVYDNLLPTSANLNANFNATRLQLNRVQLHMDMVRMSDAYYEIIDRELLDQNGLGVQYTVNTVECVPVTIPAPTSLPSAPSSKTLIASKGTRYLKSFYWTVVPNFALATGVAPPSSVFIPAGFQSAQLVVNSRRFPQRPIDSLPRAYSEMSKSVGKFNSVVGDSIITYNKYAQDLTGAVGDLSAVANVDCEYSSCVMGVNFEQVLDASDIELQGENSLTSGFQLQLEIVNNPSVACTAFLFPHFAKVLRIKGGAISILN
jgi:hypothetical protein